MRLVTCLLDFCRFQKNDWREGQDSLSFSPCELILSPVGSGSCNISAQEKPCLSINVVYYCFSEMSSINSKQTPKKNCTSSVPVDISSCRLCRAVGDTLWSKNLLVKRNRALLAAAEDICGHTLKQEDNLLPHLISWACKRRIKKFCHLQDPYYRKSESQKSFERVKHCTEISPSVTRTLMKCAKESQKISSLLYNEHSSAQQQNAMEKEVNLQGAGEDLSDISTIGNVQYDEVQFQVNCAFLSKFCCLLTTVRWTNSRSI